MTPIVLRHIPGYGKARAFIRDHMFVSGFNPFLRDAPPGHFYSPIPDIRVVKANAERLFDRNVSSVPGVELNEQRQLALLSTLSAHQGENPWRLRDHNRTRYRNNEYFGPGSADILYAMMRHLNPRRIIEVGSGWSSAAMLDVNESAFNGEISLTFIDPHPARLEEAMSKKDAMSPRIIASEVQVVPSELFSALQANDILFIDSSHVAKIGSDVLHLLTNVLPQLAVGVVVHIHDIYWPFEYPRDWVLAGKAWNEAYLVRAFLQFNASFEIILFNSYISTRHPEQLSRHFSEHGGDIGSSLWLQRMA